MGGCAGAAIGGPPPASTSASNSMTAPTSPSSSSPSPSSVISNTCRNKFSNPNMSPWSAPLSSPASTPPAPPTPPPPPASFTSPPSLSLPPTCPPWRRGTRGGTTGTTGTTNGASGAIGPGGASRGATIGGTRGTGGTAGWFAGPINWCSSSRSARRCPRPRIVGHRAPTHHGGWAAYRGTRRAPPGAAPGGAPGAPGMRRRKARMPSRMSGFHRSCCRSMKTESILERNKAPNSQWITSEGPRNASVDWPIRCSSVASKSSRVHTSSPQPTTWANKQRAVDRMCRRGHTWRADIV